MLLDRYDIDIVTDYNGDNYDLPYIARRMAYAPPIPLDNKQTSLRSLGRIRVGYPITVEKGEFTSKQVGTKEMWKLKNVYGRQYMDMLTIIGRSMSLRSYRLKATAPLILCHMNAYEIDLTMMTPAKIAKTAMIRFFGLVSEQPLVSCDGLLPSSVKSIVDRKPYPFATLEQRFYRLSFEQKIKATSVLVCFYDADDKMVHYAIGTRASDEQKEDLHYTLITEYWNGTEDQRQELAVYCLRDAILPMLLMWRMRSLPNYIEMSRVFGIGITDLVKRGQSIKTQMLIQRFCHDKGFIVPYFPPRIKVRRDAFRVTHTL